MKRILLASVVISSVAAYSQSASPEVISTAGSHDENGTIQVSWTMGEVITETTSNGVAMLTQGFHQTNLSSVSVSEVDESIVFNAFPSPVMNMLTVNVGDQAIGNILTLFTTDGLIAFEKEIEQKSQLLDFTDYASGTYFLTLSMEGKLLKTIKIQKTH
ncbi:MAG: T9SS type A sorting domain-containing protein [Crocinitomicaceae bacterium]|nr:T9SS type A sorting domain-containing protein [Crocinitomicaceae bacterium]